MASAGLLGGPDLRRRTEALFVGVIERGTPWPKKREKTGGIQGRQSLGAEVVGLLGFA